LSIAILVVMLQLTVAHSGEIRGTVHAEGKAGVSGDAAGGKYDSRKYKFVERVNYADLRNFVVYIDADDQHARGHQCDLTCGHQAGQSGESQLHARRPADCLGTIVEWPNNDDIFHNVFSMSDAKSIDLGLYKGNPRKNE